MLCLEDTKIEFKSQGFKAKQIGVSPSGEETVLMMESITSTEDQRCPQCGGNVHIYDSFQMHLKDMPLFAKTPMTLFCTGNRYRKHSQRISRSDIPVRGSPTEPRIGSRAFCSKRSPSRQYRN